jgi:hypothetical protein
VIPAALLPERPLIVASTLLDRQGPLLGEASLRAFEGMIIASGAR